MANIQGRLQDLINLSQNDKYADHFYIKFLGMDANISNFIGSRVMTFAPPALEVDIVRHNVRQNDIMDPGRYMKTPFNLSLRGDDNGVLEMILVAQFIHQKEPVEANQLPKRFDMEVQHFNQSKELKYSIVYKNCFLSTLSLPDMNHGQKEPAIYSLTVQYETTQYKSEMLDFMLEF